MRQCYLGDNGTLALQPNTAWSSRHFTEQVLVRNVHVFNSFLVFRLYLNDVKLKLRKINGRMGLIRRFFSSQ